MIPLKIQMGTFSDYLHSILTSTKASKFRAGFIKKDGSYREGTFDLKNRKKLKQMYDTVTFMNFKELLKDPFQNGIYHHNTFGWRSKRSSSDYDRLIKYIEETE